MKYFLVLLAFFLLLLSNTGCAIKFKNSKSKDFDFPDLVLGDFKYISSDTMGIKEWELRASEAKIYNASSLVYLYNMTMAFFNEKGGIKTFVSGNMGFINQKNLNVFSQGNVNILSDNKSRLKGNKVYWDNEKSIFYSEEGELVTYIKDKTVIKGYNLKADSDLREVFLESTISVTKP